VIQEFDRESVKQVVDSKIDGLGMNGSGFELVDVEQGAKHTGHAVERFVCPTEQAHRPGFLDLAVQLVVQEGQELQRLAQIVADRGEKVGLVEIGVLGRPPRSGELLFDSAKIGDVVERDEDQTLGLTLVPDMRSRDDQRAPPELRQVDLDLGAQRAGRVAFDGV
jgi:hypothetical protein